MDPIAEIEQLKAHISALEDMAVTALALALKSTPDKYQEMMNMWLMSISRVDLATFNAVKDMDLDLDDENETEEVKSGPEEPVDPLKFMQRQRIALRVEEAMKQMFEE